MTPPQEATPLRVFLRDCQPWGESGRQAQRASTGPQNAGKAQLSARAPEARGGTGLLVKIPARVHLLLVMGTCYFLISPWYLPGFSHGLFTFCLVPCPHLAQNQTVSLPPTPTALLCPPDGRPQGTFVCLNLWRTFHGANRGLAEKEGTNQPTRTLSALPYRTLSA